MNVEKRSTCVTRADQRALADALGSSPEPLAPPALVLRPIAHVLVLEEQDRLAVGARSGRPGGRTLRLAQAWRRCRTALDHAVANGTDVVRVGPGGLATAVFGPAPADGRTRLVREPRPLTRPERAVLESVDRRLTGRPVRASVRRRAIRDGLLDTWYEPGLPQSEQDTAGTVLGPWLDRLARLADEQLRRRADRRGADTRTWYTCSRGPTSSARDDEGEARIPRVTAARGIAATVSRLDGHGRLFEGPPTEGLVVPVRQGLEGPIDVRYLSTAQLRELLRARLRDLFSRN